VSQTGVFKGVNKQVDEGSPVRIVLSKVIKQFPNQALSSAVFLQFSYSRIDLQERKR